MIIQHKRAEMIDDLNARGVHKQKYHDPHSGDRFEVYDRAEFLQAIEQRVPKPMPASEKWIEVYAAYKHWLRYKYPDTAQAILDAEFEASYKAFSRTMDDALSDG